MRDWFPHSSLVGQLVGIDLECKHLPPAFLRKTLLLYACLLADHSREWRRVSMVTSTRSSSLLVPSTVCIRDSATTRKVRGCTVISMRGCGMCGTGFPWRCLRHRVIYFWSLRLSNCGRRNKTVGRVGLTYC